MYSCCFFFFQAEDGIRDSSVTGVQTCALPICIAVKAGADHPDIATVSALRATLLGAKSVAYSRIGASGIFFAQLIERMRSEERRVGKECRSRWSPYH